MNQNIVAYPNKSFFWRTFNDSGLRFAIHVVIIKCIRKIRLVQAIIGGACTFLNHFFSFSFFYIHIGNDCLLNTRFQTLVSW